MPFAFFAGDPAQGGALLGSVATPHALLPGATAAVELGVPGASDDLLDGATPVYVRVDDEAPAHAWRECRADNNLSSGSGRCP